MTEIEGKSLTQRSVSKYRMFLKQLSKSEKSKFQVQICHRAVKLQDKIKRSNIRLSASAFAVFAEETKSKSRTPPIGGNVNTEVGISPFVGSRSREDCCSSVE
ncbi:hypothetical protein CDAR_510121 [Caerostris darwini]|uniref:Uncharacterized protein n=1 Tax=Caerostris darwini TaxID=1538125 RepID=A0AAV4X5D4_9ARAC|nr:hypothetical protein CDAR_510121 [Caerostris darwini]